MSVFQKREKFHRQKPIFRIGNILRYFLQFCCKTKRFENVLGSCNFPSGYATLEVSRSSRNLITCRFIGISIAAPRNFHPMEVVDSRRKLHFRELFSFLRLLLLVENLQRKSQTCDSSLFSHLAVSHLTSGHFWFTHTLISRHFCRRLSEIFLNFSSFSIRNSAATRKTFGPFARKTENEKVLSNLAVVRGTHESEFSNTNTSEEGSSNGKFIEGNFTGCRRYAFSILRKCAGSLIILACHESRHKFFSTGRLCSAMETLQQRNKSSRVQ